MSTVRLKSAESTLKHLKTTLSKGNNKEEKFHTFRGKITQRCTPTELRKKNTLPKKKRKRKNCLGEGCKIFYTEEKTICHSEIPSKVILQK